MVQKPSGKIMQIRLLDFMAISMCAILSRKLQEACGLHGGMVLLCSQCRTCFRAVAFTLTELQLLKCLTRHAHNAGDMWPKITNAKLVRKILCVLSSFGLCWAWLLSKHTEFQPARSYCCRVTAKTTY